MVQQWQSDLEAWAAGWNAVAEDASTREVRAWDGALPGGDGGVAVLVCDPVQTGEARGAVQAAGREVLATEVLLSGDVQELDRGLGFPGEAGMFDAPMGDHLRFEVDEWGRPVAHSSLAVQGDVAFMGPVVAGTAADRDPAEVLDPLVSAMANEAFLADAQRLYTVVPEEDVPGREPQGWQRAATVLRLS